ncbi:MAG: DUF5670 family protein [Acidobacteriota bacterium]
MLSVLWLIGFTVNIGGTLINLLIAAAVVVAVFKLVTNCRET